MVQTKQNELKQILTKQAESFLIEADHTPSILDVYPCVPIL